jgi:hypothetical protein
MQRFFPYRRKRKTPAADAAGVESSYANYSAEIR